MTLQTHLYGALNTIYLQRYNAEFGKNIKRFDAYAQKDMHLYSWPGNICELKRVICVAVLKSCSNIITKNVLELDTPISR